MVSSAYLRLLLFYPAVLIPPCASSSPAFLMMYSAYKLNKQGDNIYGHCLKVIDAPIMRLLFGGLVSGKVLHMH